MASAAYFYDHTWRLTNTGLIDLDTDTLKIALVTSAYTPNLAHTQWSDVSANEASSGSGYTTGGATIANPVVTNDNIDYDDVVFPSLTKTFRYAVCYASKTVAGLTNPLLFYVLLDTTHADIVSSGSNYMIQINPVDGLFYK